MKKSIFLLPILLLLTSCGGLVPQRMDVDIYIDKNGSYKINLKGSFAEYAVLSHEAAKDELTKTDENSITKNEDSILKDPRFKNIKKIAKGKYELEYSETGELKQGNELFKGAGFFDPMMEINFKGEKELEVSEKISKYYDSLTADENEKEFKEKYAAASKEEREEYERDKIKVAREKEYIFKNVDVTLKIRTNARVIKHNAQKSPWFFGLFGAYEWHIKTPDDPAPYMLLELEN